MYKFKNIINTLFDTIPSLLNLVVIVFIIVIVISINTMEL